MKKLIILSIFAMALMGVMPVAVAIDTTLNQDTSDGTPPEVLVSWVARGDDYTDPTKYWEDDDPAEYSQILPPGNNTENTTIAMCAIVESEYGVDYIDNVYADVFYPVDVALGEHHTKLYDQSGAGCGEFMQQDLLSVLTKQQGIDLFCTNVKDKNHNLPTWFSEEAYDVLCGTTGKLYKDEARVYCGKKTISYEDPSGFYKVTTLAQDNNGQSGTQDHGFTYMPLDAFEVDFSNINYGNVKLNTTKVVSGDLIWNPLNDSKPTVRNVGNTRLQISVLQDDMNLGKTSGLWNVEYGARIGHVVDFTTYDPDSSTPILDELDLSEKNEMDFSILVKKFPYPAPTDGFVGTMTLSAAKVDHLDNCGE